MSEEKTLDPSSVKIRLSYCDHIDVYHYERNDGDEFVLTGSQLEDVISGHVKTGNSREAEFMANLTALGRRFPHKLLEIDGKGDVHVTAMTPVEKIPDPAVAEPAKKE